METDLGARLLKNHYSVMGKYLMNGADKDERGMITLTMDVPRWKEFFAEVVSWDRAIRLAREPYKAKDEQERIQSMILERETRMDVISAGAEIGNPLA